MAIDDASWEQPQGIEVWEGFQGQVPGMLLDWSPRHWQRRRIDGAIQEYIRTLRKEGWLSSSSCQGGYKAWTCKGEVSKMFLNGDIDQGRVARNRLPLKVGDWVLAQYAPHVLLEFKEKKDALSFASWISDTDFRGDLYEHVDLENTGVFVLGPEERRSFMNDEEAKSWWIRLMKKLPKYKGSHGG